MSREKSFCLTENCFLHVKNMIYHKTLYVHVEYVDVHPRILLSL
jgi:hypothetical protein